MNEPGETGKNRFGSFKEFLEVSPIKGKYSGRDVVRGSLKTGGAFYRPELTLHCYADCKGIRNFKSVDVKPAEYDHGHAFGFVQYACKNCNKDFRYFALIAERGDQAGCENVVKLGQYPYGPHLGSEMIGLLGPDYNLLMKGRESESLGLGIGAFTYYRRIVENQKDRLLDQIIKVAQKLGSPSVVIASLENAKHEHQFSTAVAKVIGAIPEVLYIDGRNPLTSLHASLSEGVHDLSDEECVERAHDIRVVLDGLADRIKDAMKDESELVTAVRRIEKRAQKKS